MERRDSLKQLIQYGGCLGCMPILGLAGHNAVDQSIDQDTQALRQEKEFIQNWLTDLMNTIDKELDDETKKKLMAGCGKGCYDRHKFKQDISAQGKGSVDNLIEAYKKNFEIWKAEDGVHIRYGKVSKRCYCPVANRRPVRDNDIFCECTRATHQTVFETALARPVKAEVLESLRRGGKTCHFLLHV